MKKEIYSLWLHLERLHGPEDLDGIGLEMIECIRLVSSEHLPEILRALELVLDSEPAATARRNGQTTHEIVPIQEDPTWPDRFAP